MTKIEKKQTHLLLLAVIFALCSTSVFGLNMPPPDAKDIPAIAVAARASAAKIKDPNVRLNVLLGLAHGLIQDGDFADARNVVADARDMAPLPTNAANINSYHYLIDLSVQAGDADAARAFAKKAPPDDIVMALAAFAAAEATAGNSADAMSTLKDIETEVVKLSASTSQESVSQPYDTCAIKHGYDCALDKIGTALIAKNDIANSILVANKLVPGWRALNLLSAIAQAQHKANDQHAATDTLQKIKSMLADPTLDKQDKYYADSLMPIALAVAVCGDLKQANALIDTLPEKQRPDGRVQLVKMLAESGDYSNAFDIAKSLEDEPHFDALIEITKTQIHTGHNDDARNTLKLASDVVANMKSNMTTFLLGKGIFAGTLADYQAAVGDYTDAVESAKQVSPMVQSAEFQTIVQKEIQAGDVKALHETLPAVIDSARSNALGLGAHDLCVMVDMLVKKSYLDEAKMLVSEAQKIAVAKEGIERATSLVPVRRAQVAVGDTQGAEVTAKQISEENKKFNEVMDKHPSPFNHDDPQTTKALRIISDRTMTGDFAAANSAIELLKEPARDSSRDLLARAEAEAGQFKEALETLSSVTDADAFQRTSLLVEFIRYDRPKTL